MHKSTLGQERGLDYSMRHNWEQQQEKRQTPDCSRPKLTTEQALDHTTCRRESLKANLTGSEE